jgi:hypothetical protein
MVQNSGKTLCTDTFKPVNLPEPVRVEESASEPLAIRTPRRQAVKAIEDRWRIDDEWWRTEPVSRLYFAILLISGQRLVIYKDLINGQWYRQEVRFEA